MTVEDLIQRATGGLKLDRQSIFRPSQVYKVLKDPFWIWCQYHAPPSEAVDETSRYDEMRFQRGIEHEEAWVSQHYPDALKITPDFGFEALKNTMRAMLDGVSAIYQPQLWDLRGETYGKGDLLVRDNGHESDLGPYHYRLVEIKRSRSLQDYHVLQAAIYNRMLAGLQGYNPAELTVVLKDGMGTVTYPDRHNQLDELMASWRALRDGGHMPEPGRPPDVTESPWRVYGNKVVDDRKDLVLLAGVGAKERDKLREAGIHRVDELWNLRLEKVREILGNKHGHQAYYVAQAYKTGQPILKSKSRLNIPRAGRHLYFDFENVDDLHPTVPPHVYLIGCWDAEQDRFVHFLARGAADEDRIFREFLEYVGDVRRARLYHWTDYEIGEMTKVIQRWPELGAPLEKLMSSCVDLLQVIKSAVYLPVPTFSIKSVAPALGFHWRQDNFGAFDSMVNYWDYLDGADGAIMDNVLTYNEDDCRAMWHVDHELTKRL
ncbi:MAG: TM0106 family RecB-like putative nuclease [Candidatus Methylomirabilales bacterium]